MYPRTKQLFSFPILIIMKTLRLICTYECNRNCQGCCNKQDLFLEDNLKSIDEEDIKNVINDYHQVLITGGEPMLFQTRVAVLLARIRVASCIDVILYTAKTDWSLDGFLNQLAPLDGITITLHDQRAADEFCNLFEGLMDFNVTHLINEKSLRLNVFNGVNLDLNLIKYIRMMWLIKNNIEWIPDCPLPSNEKILKLSRPWKT